MKLSGKRAVVTGSSQGIGREIALLLAREGARVVINARGAGSAGAGAIQAVVDEIREAGGEAIGCVGPINDLSFAEELIETCVSEFGGVDILVNNAGTTGAGAVDQIDLETWRNVLDINLNGTFYCSRFAVKHMRAQRWGRVINCTSGAAFGSIGGSVYAASKSAVIGLTYAMAADLGIYGVTTNAFNPQARSRLSDQHDGGFAAVMKSRVLRGYCDEAEFQYVSGMGAPDGIAPWVAYLCLEEASYLNGRLFGVDGRRVGLYALPQEERIAFRDYAVQGPWNLEELCRIAPLMFPVTNRWARKSDEEIEALMAEIVPHLR